MCCCDMTNEEMTMWHRSLISICVLLVLKLFAGFSLFRYSLGSLIGSYVLISILPRCVITRHMHEEANVTMICVRRVTFDYRHRRLLFLSQGTSYVQRERESWRNQPCEVHCTHCMSMPCDINHKCEGLMKRPSEMQKMNEHLSHYFITTGRSLNFHTSS